MANSYNFPRCNDMSIFYKINNVRKCNVCSETNPTNRRCCCDLLFKRFPCKESSLVAPNDFSCSLRQYDACPRNSPCRTEQQPQKPVVREIFPVPSEPRRKKCPPRDATFSRPSPRSGPCTQPCRQATPVRQNPVQNPPAQRSDQSSPRSEPCQPACTQPCSQTTPAQQPAVQNPPAQQRSGQSSPRSGACQPACTQPCSQSTPVRQTPVQNPTAQPSTSGTQQQRPVDPQYAQFLLDLTTDIIRNNLNTPREYQVLYNTHVTANRNRLNEQKMWEEIELLKKRLDKNRRPDRNTNTNNNNTNNNTNNNNNNNNNDVLFNDVEQLPGFECPQNCGATRPPTTANAPREENPRDITYGKVIFKLNLDRRQQNEPYVLVDGPLLVPKSLLERNITTTILKSPYPTSSV